MARQTGRQLNPRTRYVSGSLAYDYDRIERERQRQAERERAERAARAARETAPRPAPRKKAAPARRERQRVSFAAVLGFAVLAAMAVAILVGYAQLTTISNGVVAKQRELSALEDEHVVLLTRYEQTFDLETIRAAAEAAGMAKPSASQINYIDLSAPDSVVLYQRAGGNVMSRIFTAMLQDVGIVVEYFK